MSTRVQRRLQRKPTTKNHPEKTSSSNGSSEKNPLEVPHLRRLEADLGQLGDAFNRNSHLFSHGLTVFEMHLRVHERVLHDIARGTVRTHDDVGLTEIDFKSYMEEFAICMVFSEFAQWLKGLSEKQQEIKTPGVIIRPAHDDNTLVFGGM